MSSRKRKRNTPAPDGDIKRRRPDVSERRARNANTECCTVKVSLNSFCTESARVLPWDSVLKDTNKAVTEAYILANVRVICLLQAGRPIPVLDHQFYYQCLSAVSVGLIARQEVTDQDLRHAVELYRSWRNPSVAYANGGHINRGWFQNASNQMGTNAKNHIVVNFYPRLKKYVNQRFDLTGSERYHLLRDVLSPTYDGSDERVVEIRGWIPRNTDRWLDTDNPHRILPVIYRFLQFIEAENVDHRHEPGFEQLRSFSLLPLKRGFDCSHFKMCNIGLWALLKRGGYPIPPVNKPKNGGPGWKDVADAWWRRLFKIRKFESRTRKFAGEILTDGKAVSIVLRKTKNPEAQKSSTPSKETLAQNTFGEVWGLDPGRRDLFVATNGTGDTISCSSREFYQDSKYTASNKAIRHWINHDPRVLEATRNMPSAKTCSLPNLEIYVKFLIPWLDLLLDFRMNKPFRKLRFRRFIFMKRKIRELCLKLTARAGEHTLIGFGDWSATDFGGVIKKCPPGGPVKKLEKELKRYCTVVSIPEYRTSKLHADCHRELTYQYAMRICRDGVKRRVKVYSVLHCQHSGCFGTTVNRDKNASKNILLQIAFYLRYGTWYPAFTP